MTNDPSLPSEQSTPPHTEERSVGELPGKSDVDALGNIRAVFWIVPLYALAISLIVIFYAFSNYEAMFSVLAKVRPPILYKFIFLAVALFAVGLVGVAVRSIECALILRTDPFRAFAMGRYVLVLYLIVSFPLYALGEFPRATIEAPLDAVVRTNDSTITVDASQAVLFEPNFVWWLGYLAVIACEFVTTFSMVAFSFATYRILSHGRKPYVFDHFLHDITFTWKGKPYVEISDDAKTDLGLKHYLAALETHTALNLSGWKITDVGLVHLKGLTKLETLSLRDTKITDAGLVHLKGLTNLQELSLYYTKVTDAGVADLQKSLPNCTITKY